MLTGVSRFAKVNVFSGMNNLEDISTNPQFAALAGFTQEELEDSNLDFGNYWFSTGTPTFLIDLITRKKQLPEAFEGIKVMDLTGSTTNIKNLPLLPLLYQTGYLTIAKMERDGFGKYYYLDYPNEEVRYSFLTYVAAGFTGKDQYEIQPEVLALRDALREERTDHFIKYPQTNKTK